MSMNSSHLQTFSTKRSSSLANLVAFLNILYTYFDSNCIFTIIVVYFLMFSFC